MKQILILIFVIFLGGACKDSSSRAIDDFGRTVSLKHTVRNPQITAWLPSPPIIVDSTLIVVSLKLGENIIRFFSLKDFQEKGCFGVVGRGPDEFLDAEPMRIGDSAFIIFDANNFAVTKFKLKHFADSVYPEKQWHRKIIQNEDDLKGEYDVLGCYNDQYYVGICEKQQDKYFVLLDSNMHFIRYFGHALIPEEAGDYGDQMQGIGVICNGLMAYTCYNVPRIVCYAMQDSIPVKLWEDTFYKSYYTVKNRRILYSKVRTKGLVTSLAISPKYIYVGFNEYLLSEQSVQRPETYESDLILVYDHLGNRIGRLKLDVSLFEFCVDDNDDTLYGIVETPDYGIVTFDLPDWK